MRALRRDRCGATALEFALVFPAILLTFFALLAIFTLVASRRAIDYGIERALRTGAVNSAGGTAAMKTAFTNAAATVWSSAASGAVVTITVSAGGTGTAAASATFNPGDVVQVAVTYNWLPPSSYGSPVVSKILNPATLSTSGSMRAIN